jgi:hypothetical protein
VARRDGAKGAPSPTVAPTVEPGTGANHTPYDPPCKGFFHGYSTGKLS